MSCIDTEIFYLFVDQELDKKEDGKVLQHIGECAKCKEQFDSIIKLEKNLKLFWSYFRAVECPKPLVLYEFRFRKELLNAEKLSEIKKHLEFCHVCNMIITKSEEMEKELLSFPIDEELTKEKTISTVYDKAKEMISGFIDKNYPNQKRFFDVGWDIIKEHLSTGKSFGYQDSNFASALGMASVTPEFSQIIAPAAFIIFSAINTILAATPKPSKEKIISIIREKAKECRTSKKITEEIEDYILNNLR